MIDFSSLCDFDFAQNENVVDWLSSVILVEDKMVGEIHYIFCDDQYLHKINVDFLNHDTLTDIISFDYSSGSIISGDIYISIERVRENAVDYKVDFMEELHRVMVHGILHYCGYGDKTSEEAMLMRDKENTYLAIK